MSETVFFESRGKHAVKVRATGQRVIGKVFWNKATGVAFVADPARGMQRVSPSDAERAWKEERARDKGGRPRLFKEDTDRVTLTLPKRLLNHLYPKKEGDSLSRNAARLLEKVLSESTDLLAKENYKNVSGI